MTPNDYINTLPAVIQYRQAYFEIRGNIAPGDALPTTRAWPNPNNSLSYREKLISGLPLTTGKGVELGPLNIPIVRKTQGNILYVDYLNTENLRKVYSNIPDIVPVDRSILNNDLKETLQNDLPIDYMIASQVFEHVSNPIKWLQELAAVLNINGLLSLSIPDRRNTFDFLREETRTADLMAEYLEAINVPTVRTVYDSYSLGSMVNMGWLPEQVYPKDIIAGRGSIKPKLTCEDYMPVVHRAKMGEYIGVHNQVFTPPNFLLIMAQLAIEGVLSFKLKQFYPTNFDSVDRDNHSFTVILEKTNADRLEIRRSFLQALGDN